MARRPLIGITADLIDRNGRETAACTTAYSARVWEAGGLPVLLSPLDEGAVELAARMDGFVLTGGDDPRTEPFGEPTDPRVTPVFPARQAFETALLEHLRDEWPEKPVLGVCLGMQMMALVRGGRLNQYMPDTHPNAAEHWDHDHPVVSADESALASGTVHSRHKQAIDDAGSMRVLATAPDGTIEAVDLPDLPFYLGVQWHPERTEQAGLGPALFERLVVASR
ncbi:MAG: gamma-glutamyl-gamma-aminobutyrate hydrolase family protein [Phycisphaerales bacterium]|nr:gamma-glutamyl-gamma-aminobutyrate hydrolase family protein [Planctomycetota bacterium]MCH8507733.1 gamma-glutamyl-gamma-aminobutyrate hydrolase family protein [Phycisphaerales bacterium]